MNLLHISDVHFGCSDSLGEQARIVEGIVSAISESGVSINFLVFTGDLSQAAHPGEFQQGQDWLVNICETLKCQAILVPGNHDADRSKAATAELRTAYQNEEAFGHQKSKIYRSHDHLLPFMQWFQQAKAEHDYFLNNWGTNPAIDRVDTNVNGREIVFVCINTALLSCDNSDKTKLCVDIAPINSALHKCDTRKQLVIAIGHHPTGDLAVWNKDEFCKLLGQETGPHLYMHGHLHESENGANYSGAGGGIYRSAAGAAYPGSNWTKSFTVINIDCDAQSVTPTVFNFFNDSGKWLPASNLSRSVPTRLPSLPPPAKPPELASHVLVQGNSPIAKSQVLAAKHDSVEREIGRWSNPFSDVMANGMDPEAVHRLFVDQSNSLTSLSNHVDTIIEGQRGTGKTMLLRYFSFEVQYSLAQSVNDTPIINHLNEKNLPFGVYCCLSNAGMNRSDYDAIQSKERCEALFAHRLVVFIVCKLFESLQLLQDKNSLGTVEGARIQKFVTRQFRMASLPAIDTFKDFCEYVAQECNFMLEAIDEHVASALPGGTVTVFNPWLSLSNSLIALLKIVKDNLSLKAPFFLLIDDFDLLNGDQQATLFKTAAIRNHSLVCFKFGIMSEGRKSAVAGDGRTYRSGDDYSLIPLNWIDKGLEQDTGDGNYASMVEEISRRRMQRAGWPQELSFKTLFNTWEHGDKIRKEVKAVARLEYDSLPKGAKPMTFETFWEKQGDAKYFRYLKSKKIEHRYAGPSTIIDLSSGIFRQFLEIGSAIVNSALAADWTPGSGKKIGPQNQNRAIRDWSRDMLRSLGSSGDISTLSKRKFEVTSQDLINLANSLSQFFAARLFSESKDPEVIAIAVKGDIQSESFVRALLEVAVRESILQPRSVDYPSKSGGERLPTFLLNRRLVPHVGIGTKLQGRHEIDVETLVLASQDTSKFLEKMAFRKSANDDQLGLL